MAAFAAMFFFEASLLIVMLSAIALGIARIVRNPVGNELAVTPLRSPKFARFAVAGHVQAWIDKGTF